MCYERRRAEACVNESAHHALAVLWPGAQPLAADGGCGSMFALVKPDLRACTRLLSVAAAARSSQLLLLEARRCCWIWMLMERARTWSSTSLCRAQSGLIRSW